MGSARKCLVRGERRADCQIAHRRFENLLTHTPHPVGPFPIPYAYRPRPGRPAMSPRQLAWAGLRAAHDTLYRYLTHLSHTNLYGMYLTRSVHKYRASTNGSTNGTQQLSNVTHSARRCRQHLTSVTSAACCPCPRPPPPPPPPRQSPCPAHSADQHAWGRRRALPKPRPPA